MQTSTKAGHARSAGRLGGDLAEAAHFAPRSAKATRKVAKAKARRALRAGAANAIALGFEG